MSLRLNTFVGELLEELQEDTITTIFGPPAAGKTTLCLQYCAKCSNDGKKVLFIDTEGGFSAQRLKQIDPNINLSNILVISPKTFEEQKKTIFNLNKQIKSSNQIGLIVIDSLVMLYRLKLEDAPQKINSNLAEQLRMLTEISRVFKIPIIVSNQMYTHFDTKQRKMVGGNLIEYWSKTILELNKEGDIRTAKLIKHKFKPESEEIQFQINNEGLVKQEYID